MAWLVPSIIATMAGTAILSACYCYLFFQDRKKYLKIWSISWAIYFLRYVFMLAFVLWMKNPFLLIGTQVSTLISGILLLYGSYLFIGKKLSKYILYVAVFDAVWISFSILNGLNFLIMALPTFTILAIIYIWTGYIFLKRYRKEKMEAQIIGWAFIVWGIHKANYPFLRPVEWFVPWGYLLTAVLAIITALGFILIYLKKTKNALIENQSHLEKIAWMQDYELGGAPESRVPYYGDVTKLNTARTIRDSVGLETLEAMGADLMGLLDTSVAVYEKNGDYAYGCFVSEWCSLMDGASRKLCQTDDNQEALSCGRWLCHENCWNESARAAIESGKPTDIACVGGIHLYGMPIFAGDEVVGAINIGYGNPPTDDETLAEHAESFGVDMERLRHAALAFNPRPAFVVENAKARLHLVAKQIGQMVENRQKQDQLHRAQALLYTAMDNSPAGIAIADAPSGKLNYVNDAGLLIRGGSREEIVNGVGVDQYVATWKMLDQDGSPLPADEVPLARAIKYGEACSREFIIRRAIGDDRTVLARAAAIKDKYGKVEAAIVVFLDITERKRAEEALRKSEARHMSMVANISDVIGIIGADGFMIYKSPNIEKWFGWKPEDLVGTDGWLTVHPDDLERIQKEFYALLEKDKSGTKVEYRYKCKDGHYTWIELTATNLINDPLIGGVLLNYHDITERRKADDALQKSEEKFRRAFMTSPDSININGMSDGRYIEVNDGFLRIMGYSREEVIGRTSLELNIWKNPEDRKTLVEGLQADGYVENLSAQFCRADGAVREGLMSACVVELEGKQRILSITRDVTERIRAEEAYKSQNALLSMIMETSPVGITTVDVDGSITYANEQAEQILGMERSKIAGRKYDAPEWHHTDIDGKPFPDEKQPFYIVKTTGKPAYNIRHGIAWPDGRSVILSINASPMKDKEGRFSGMVATLEDITDRIQAEAEREKLQIQLAQSQKMESVGRLAGGVAHDFNNMLNVILGHAEMMLDDLPEGSSLRDDLGEIHKAAERSANLTRQLLAFARRQTVAPKTLDLNETIASMLKMLERLIGEDIDLIWKPGGRLNFVHIDPGQVDQMLANLAVNARDAIGHQHGKVTIETSNVLFDDQYCADHAGFSAGHYVTLAVSDDGCGMDEETRAQIFEPFFTTKDVGEGTGLGLATIYGIAKQNNGFVNVYSEPGQGTTFRIYLPAMEPKSRSHGANRDAEAPPVRGNETILIVEDEPAILNLTRSMLKRLGYTVLTAGSPSAGIQMAREESGKIDLVITDVVMPEMNGRELIQGIRKIYPDIRSLFMSGYTANVIAHQGVLDDSVHFIQKPFSQADLAGKVREALGEG